MTKWENNDIQFPRLLAEIRAIGLSEAQYKELNETMDLEQDEIDILLERAEIEWQKIKTPKKTETPHCTYCNSSNITFDAQCIWDDDAQEFGQPDIMDKGHYCADCEGECSIEWKENKTEKGN